MSGQHVTHGQEAASADTSPQPDVERRAQPRHMTVMRVAKLRTSHGEELCLVRDISTAGLMARVYSPMVPGDAVTVEFKSGHSIRAHVVWRREASVGVQFDEPVDPAIVLSDHCGTSAEVQPRAPRVNLDLAVRVRVGASYHFAILHNISQGGARLELSVEGLREKPLVLMIPGLPVTAGRVRWQDADAIGVSFNEPIAFETLAQWVASIPD